MSNVIPNKIPECAINLLAREEWYPDPQVLKRTRLAKANLIARFLSNKRFAGEEIEAITLGHTIYFRDLDAYDPHTPSGLALLAHEAKHVEQCEREGLLKFCVKYLRSYFSSGYGEDVSFEAEAYKLQRQVQKHLEKEFSDNPGQNTCQEMGDPHTPNEAFVKAKPEKFLFVV